MTLPDFDSINYAVPHFVLTLCGAVLSMWVMQLVSIGHIGRDDGRCLRVIRRLSVAAVGMSMLWALNYGLERDWQPWPPFMLLTLGIDMMMAASVIAYYTKKRVKTFMADIDSSPAIAKKNIQ